MIRLVAIDPGHDLSTAGKETPFIPEIGRKIKENEFNRAVANYFDIELKRCGFSTVMVAKIGEDTSLLSRVNLANIKGADAYVSIHYNAFDGKFDQYDPQGLGVHIYPGSVEGRKLGESILKHLKTGTLQTNRGIKENNFYVLRNTKMPAILSENGFMDNKREALLMLDVNFQKEVAREHAQGICDYFGVKYIPFVAIPIVKPADKISSVNTMYRVVTGSFSDRANADQRIAELKKAGFESFIAIK